MMDVMDGWMDDGWMDVGKKLPGDGGADVIVKDANVVCVVLGGGREMLNNDSEGMMCEDLERVRAAVGMFPSSTLLVFVAQRSTEFLTQVEDVVADARDLSGEHHVQRWVLPVGKDDESMAMVLGGALDGMSNTRALHAGEEVLRSTLRVKTRTKAAIGALAEVGCVREEADRGALLLGGFSMGSISGLSLDALDQDGGGARVVDENVLREQVCDALEGEEREDVEVGCSVAVRIAEVLVQDKEMLL